MADTAQETCTDVIVRAMEQADNMEEVIVIYRLRDVKEGNEGVGWESNASTLHAAGMVEMFKTGLFTRSIDD